MAFLAHRQITLSLFSRCKQPIFRSLPAYFAYFFFLIRTTRVVALHITANLHLAQLLPPRAKSVLVTLLGRRQLLTGPVLRSLAHRDLQSVSLHGTMAINSTVKTLQYLTKLKSLFIPGHEISTSGK